VTVTERELRKRLGLVQAAVERLQNPEPDLQPQYSTDIYRVVVPRDLRELIQDSDKSLVVEVDAIPRARAVGDAAVGSQRDSPRALEAGRAAASYALQPASG